MEAEESAEPWIGPTGQVLGYCVQEDEEYRICLYGVGSFVFTRHSGIVRAGRDPGVDPAVFDDILHRQLQPLVLQRQSWEVLHASGLVVEGVHIALCGDSEMGKSTLAHAWRCQGGAVFADDAIPFRIEGSSVPLRSIPFKLRLRPPTLHHFGPADEDPLELSPGTAPSGTSDAGILRVIYLLDRRRDKLNGPVLVDAIRPDQALPAILKQAFCLTLRDRERNRQMIDTYLGMLNLVPVFRLTYPANLNRVGAVLDRLTAHVASLVCLATPAGGNEE